MHTLHMLSYDHQGGVPSSSVLTADGATGFAASCDKDYPHKRFKMAEVNHKENIFTKTYYFLGRLWGKSYKTIVAGTQQMEHGNTWKKATSVECSTKNPKRVPKKYTWAYSWTWRHNATLLQTVASALPQALWHR